MSEEILENISISSEDSRYFYNNKRNKNRSMATDFAICMGAKPVDKYCSYFFDSIADTNKIKVVNNNGLISSLNILNKNVGIRPIIDISSLSEDVFDFKTVKGMVYNINLFNYPQDAASREVSSVLENVYNDYSFCKSSDTFIYPKYSDFDSEDIEYDVYEFQSGKYIRLICNHNVLLSNKLKYVNGDAIWIKFAPITWTYNSNSNYLITSKVISAGVPFTKKNYYDGDFRNTELYDFLVKHFSPVFNNKKIISTPNLSTVSLDDISFNSLDEKNTINALLDSDVTVYLHGLSGDGKSERVKKIDPECEILYLSSATPESINGKEAYDEKNSKIISIKPSWLVKFEKKCEETPDVYRILFFDELSNAPASIQKYVFNIILNKEVDGKWTLPENARIICAGNETKDSICAYSLPEPLFNRCAHIYINTTADNWLVWANENNIHPLIVSFIMYRGDDVLRTEYNGEVPNADPRKWAMASKVLYQTGNVNILSSLIGESLVTEFTAFLSLKVISLSDVLNDNYDEVYFDAMNISNKHATVIALRSASINDIEKVYNFVKLLGAEYLRIFENVWIMGDKTRFDAIEILKIKNKNLIRTR